MSRHQRGAKADSRGFLVPMAVVALVLIGFAALLTARVVGTLVRASIQESLAAVERATSRTAAAALDAWMADRAASVLLITQDPQVVDPAVWRNPLAAACDWTVDTSCWRIDSVTSPGLSAVTLRGGQAQREVTEIAVTVVSGCDADGAVGCLRTGSFLRRYERAIFAYYQLHYDSHGIPRAVELGPDGLADPADCATGSPADPLLCDGLAAGTQVVFTSADTLTGPLRTGLDRVWYCGRPTFSLVEVGIDMPVPLRDVPQQAAATIGGVSACPGTPVWDGRASTLPPPTAQDLVNEGRVEYGGTALTRVLPTAPPTVDHNCPSPVDFDGIPVNLPCRDFADGDVLMPPTGINDLEIDQLRLDGAVPGSITGSVTVYAPGDITIRGDVAAGGTNPAGGPNVVALIAGGDVIIAPAAAAGASCLDDTLHRLSLTNVAILAAGGVYAPQWRMPLCAGVTLAPELTITGSISAHYLGVYGNPDLLTGDVTGGWSKQFSYPPNFWLARPAWWPGFSEREWDPAIAAGTQTVLIPPVTPAPVPDPGVLDPAAALTAYTQARDCVTAAVTPLAVHDYSTAQYELGYQTQAAACRAAAGLHPDVPLGESTPNDLPDPAAPGGASRLSRAIDELARSVGVPVPAAQLLEASPAALPVTEGATATFDVSVLTQPSDLVTVTVTSADPAVAAVFTPEVTFSSTTWATAKTVTVSGVQDATIDDETTTVTLTAVSTDPNYDGMTADVSVSVTDDDAPGFVLPDTAVTITEGTDGTFTVTLAARPGAGVTLRATSADTAAVTVAPATINVNADAWDTVRTFTVTGVADDDAANESVAVTIHATGSGWASSPPAAVTVTVTDDETAAIEVDQPSLAVDENNTTTFSVVLTAQPLNTVTITAASDDTSTVTVTPATRTFTTSDWNMAKTFTVTGVDNSDSGNGSATVTVTAASSDTSYDGQTASTAVTVTDDDAVTALTVTCDAAVENITIAWPEDGAIEVFVEGPGSLAAVWTDVAGSRIQTSVAALAGWSGFTGGNLTVYVYLPGDIFVDHYGVFSCP